MTSEPLSTARVDDAMRNLCVWSFDDIAAARRLEREVGDIGVEPVVVADGVVLTWLPGRRVPQIREAQNVGRSGVLGFTFWGLLFGIVAAGPNLSGSSESTRCSLDESLSAVGIGSEFISAIRIGLVPATSAFAVCCDDPTADLIAVAARAPRVVAGPGVAATTVKVQRQLSDLNSSDLRRIFAV